MDAALASWGGELDAEVSNLASVASNISDADARIRRLQERIRAPTATGGQKRLPASTTTTTAALKPRAVPVTSSPRQLPHGLVPPGFASPAPPHDPPAESPRLTPPELRRILADASGCSPVSPALTPPPVWTPASVVPKHGKSATADTQNTQSRTDASSQSHQTRLDGLLGAGVVAAGTASHSNALGVPRMPLRTPPPAWTPATTNREPTHQAAYPDSAQLTAPSPAVRATPLRWDEEDSLMVEEPHTGSLGGALMAHAASLAARRGSISTTDREANTRPVRYSPSGRVSSSQNQTADGNNRTIRSVTLEGSYAGSTWDTAAESAVRAMPRRTPRPAETPATSSHEPTHQISHPDCARHTAPESAVHETMLRTPSSAGTSVTPKREPTQQALYPGSARHAASRSTVRATALRTPPPAWTPATTNREPTHQAAYPDSAQLTAPSPAVRATPLRWDEEDSLMVEEPHTGSLGGALMAHAASLAARRGSISTTDREANTRPVRYSPSGRVSSSQYQTADGNNRTIRSIAPRRATCDESATSREDLRELNPLNVKLLLETVEQVVQRKCNLDSRIESLRDRVAVFASAQHDASGHIDVGDKGLRLAVAGA